MQIVLACSTVLGRNDPSGRFGFALTQWTRRASPNATSARSSSRLRSARLAAADKSGSLSGFLQPGLREAEKAVAQVEGWILGVAGELDLLDHREASHAVH